MIPEEEGLPREVELEEEAKRMSTSVSNVTSWVIDLECPENKNIGQQGEYIDQSEAVEAPAPTVENVPETREDLMMNKFLLNPSKEIVELA